MMPKLNRTEISEVVHICFQLINSPGQNLCTSMSIVEAERVPLTAVVVVPQLNPNLPTQEEYITITKRRRPKNHKTRDNKPASSNWFLSNANEDFEDMLLEIFLRLPNSRSAIQCSSVCRRWLQLISQPQFIQRFIGMHRDDHLCYTILFRRRYYYSLKPPEYYQVVCKLFSNESLLLHGSSSNYNLDFMPFLVSIRASCNDLLLVSPYPPVSKFYICNPVTKLWSLIPGNIPRGTRIGFALISHQDIFKVVIIYHPRPSPGIPPDVPDSNYNYGTRVVAFCAKSGQWSEYNLLFPMRDTRDYSFALEVVACNGILYWMDGCQHLDRIIALDLFNGDQRGGVLINLPEPIHIHDVADVTVRLAAVKGGNELRLLHMFRAGGGEDRKCFVVKVWELNYRDGNSWVLVHDKNLIVPNADENNVVSAAFHPKDCDVIFVICGMIVFQYRVLEDRCDKIGEIREPIGIECLDSFVLEHPPWPTVVPSF